MPAGEPQPQPRYRLIGEKWDQGWFFVCLMAGLMLGLAGFAGALAAFFTVRALGPKVPRAAALAGAVAAGVLVTAGVKALMALG